MENLLEGIAFALLIGAQVLAVIAVHAARTKDPSGQSSSTDRWSWNGARESLAKEPPFRERREPQSAPPVF